ncbi:hypothetical protein [Streptomyces viridochromogenes]|nr:hypothetical protein [Streptomyces viridochromogenes]
MSNRASKTFVGGVEVEVPKSIPDIRAALPEEERREDFDRAINSTGAHDIHAVMRHWMLEAGPEPKADALLERLVADEAATRGFA